LPTSFITKNDNKKIKCTKQAKNCANEVSNNNNNNKTTTTTDDSPISNAKVKLKANVRVYGCV